jgi:hypothetical protein
MPGFGDNPNTDDDPDDGMFTPDMVKAVAEYEMSLGSETGGTGVATPPEDEAATTTTTEEP